MRLSFLSLVGLCIAPGLLLAQETVFDDVIDSPMYRMPLLPVPAEVVTFPVKAVPLWLRALERPEANMRYKAAEAIALARRAGMKGLANAITPLRAALDRPEEDPAVRLALIDALVTLDVRDAADGLFALAKNQDIEVRNLVEPALARWDYQPARTFWLERLAEPQARTHSLALAIRGLAAVREEKAVEPLRKLLLVEETGPATRVEAARALGTLRQVGLEGDAERLLSDGSRAGIPARLAAVAVLAHHDSVRTLALLQRLAADTEPAVAAAALGRLLAIKPAIVAALAERLVKEPDAQLRLRAVEGIFRQPTDKGIRLLGSLLGDSHRSVRSQARRSLEKLALKPGLRPAVIAAATRMLTSERWQALEQSAILAAQLDHKPAAGRIVELLEASRPEVFVTAAWALRKLAVPETYPQITRHAQAQWQRLLPRKEAATKVENAQYVEHELSQLHQCLGLARFAPADRVLRRCVPKPGFPVFSEARASAVWALGLIHAGKPDPQLGRAFEGRLADMGKPPEDQRVRAMAAISLGRMKSTEQLPSLRRFCPTQQASASQVSNACGWAIEQMTGEKLKAPLPGTRAERWFLMPLE